MIHKNVVNSVLNLSEIDDINKLIESQSTELWIEFHPVEQKSKNVLGGKYYCPWLFYWSWTIDRPAIYINDTTTFDYTA